MNDVPNTGAMGRLVDATLPMNDESANAAAQRGEKAVKRLSPKHRFTKSDISDLRNGKRPTLVPEKIIGLAAALQLPAYKVAIAWLADHGIDIPQDVRTPEDAIAHDHTLSARVRRDLLTLIANHRDRD